MNKAFDRILIVMFENQYRSYVMRDPYMQKLAAAGCQLTNSFGAFHPSQTNYVASLAGEVCAVTNDIPPYPPLTQQTLVDLMENAATPVSWKAYMEGYPGQAWDAAWKNQNYPASQQPINEFPTDGVQLARYFRKHNAFASFHTIQAHENRWNNIVSDVEFWEDIQNKTLPEYGWFTPDIWNDGHYLFNTHVDTNPRFELVRQLAGWLEYVFMGQIATSDIPNGSVYPGPNIGLNLDLDLVMTDPKKAYAQSNIPEGTLVVITFDEADFDANSYQTQYDGPNQIYTVLLGNMITPGSEISDPYNHYSLIRTVEENFGLGSLKKNDEHSNWLRFLWGEKYSWNTVQNSGVNVGSTMSAASLQDELVVVFPDSSGVIQFSTFKNNTWTPVASTGLSGNGDLALVNEGDNLLLVFDNDGALFSSTYASNAWSAAQPMNLTSGGSLAMTSYLDLTDNTQKVMLTWREAGTEYISYMVRENGSWSGTPGAVGQLTDGPMALGQVGGSLYLVYKERNTYHLRMTSFNVAPFNAFDALNYKGEAASDNDTSLHQWSPMDFQVGHFANKFGQLQNDYQTSGAIAMATLDGEMHLAHPGRFQTTAYTERFGLTGIFTAKNASTNGYGTLDQAGWTLEEQMSQVPVGPQSGMAMTTLGDEIVLLFQADGSQELSMITGNYSA